MQYNIFENYILESIDLFWENELENTIKLNEIFAQIGNGADLKTVQDYFDKISLSHESQELMYLLLNHRLDDIIKQLKKGILVIEGNVFPLKLLEDIAQHYHKNHCKALYWYIFDVNSIEDVFEETNNTKFIELVNRYYQLTALFLPKEDIFDMDKWIERKFNYNISKPENKGKQKNMLTVAQKLLILHSMFAECGVKVGSDISKAAFLRFFQMLTNTETHINYKDSSFKKTFDSLFQKSYIKQKADLGKVLDLLSEAGLHGVIEKIKKDIEFDK